MYRTRRDRIVGRVVFTWALIALVNGSLANAETKVYAIRSDGETGIRFRLPYSLGTHEGQARLVRGQVTYDPARPEQTKGSFVVPIAELVSDDKTRDCHMRESLGLNYESSEFPEEHVCDANDELSKEGKNAIAYPEIRFEVASVTRHSTDETRLDVDGKWTIHGVTRPARITFKVSREGQAIRLKGSAPLSLASFGVVVKSAHILFVKISVADEATAVFDLLFEPAKENKR
jgi:polyisoprenoid-binding protein YceI